MLPAWERIPLSPTAAANRTWTIRLKSMEIILQKGAGKSDSVGVLSFPGGYLDVVLDTGEFIYPSWG